MNDFTADYQNTSERYWTTVSVVLVVFFSIAILSLLLITLLGRPPQNFPTDSSVEIESGMSVRDIVKRFATQNYVRSADLLYAYLIFEHDTTDIKAGVYSFDNPLTVRGVASVITEVGPSEPLLALTFPEGITVRAIAEIASQKLPNFRVATFVSFATEYEGRLFPDTYFVPETFTAEQLYDLLLQTYEKKISELPLDNNPSGFSEEEVIILASIIEREANSISSMRMVSSVLQNRYRVGMPLQADASVEYILDKPLQQLTPEDLEIESPYNTYTNTGLPPTPIGNPGIDAINAVIDPADTNYFYYLTGNDGEFHFAEDYEQHKRNIARYLR